jgi:hypothetical protein
MTDLPHPRRQQTSPGLTSPANTRTLLGHTNPDETRIALPRKCKRPGYNVIFTPKMKHGKYCSNVCRKRDHRRRVRRQDPLVMRHLVHYGFDLTGIE